MTLKEIYQSAIKKIGAREGDRYIDSIIYTAINKAYFELSIENEPTLKTATVTALNGIAALPSDFQSIEIITPPFENGEYRKGNYILCYKNADDTDKSFEVTYVATPTELSLDSDIPLLTIKAQRLISDYAASEYYSSIGKLNEATYFMNNYINSKKKLYSSDNTFSTIQDVTGGW